MKEIITPGIDYYITEDKWVQRCKRTDAQTVETMLAHLHPFETLPRTFKQLADVVSLIPKKGAVLEAGVTSPETELRYFDGATPSSIQQWVAERGETYAWLLLHTTAHEGYNVRSDHSAVIQPASGLRQMNGNALEYKLIIPQGMTLIAPRFREHVN